MLERREHKQIHKSAEIIRQQDLEKISSFIGIPGESEVELNLVGPLLGSGGVHRVYTYGEAHVLKVPFLFPRPTHLVKKEISLINTVFSGYIKDSEVIGKPNSEEYLLRESRIFNFRHLTPDLLANVDLLDYTIGKTLQEQFADIITAETMLNNEYNSIFDYFGKEGLIETGKGRPKMTNLVVEFSGKGAGLVVMDKGIISSDRQWYPNSTLETTYMRGISHINANITQNYINKHFLPVIDRAR